MDEQTTWDTQQQTPIEKSIKELATLAGPEQGTPAADAAMAPQPEKPSPIAGFGERLRGFEIVGVNSNGTERLYAKFRPTELAARQAAADLRWLQWRHPECRYEMRALLSIGREQPQTIPAPEEGPLRLDADEPEVAGASDAAVPE